MPDTKPDEEPTVAMPVALLTHVPPPNVDDSVRVEPMQTGALPIMVPALPVHKIIFPLAEPDPVYTL